MLQQTLHNNSNIFKIVYTWQKRWGKKNRRVVKGGGIVAAMRGSLHGGDGEGNHFVRRLITRTTTFFDTEVGLYGSKD